MPEPKPSPDKDSEFGIVALEDSSAGLYYAWMGESQKGMNARYQSQEFVATPPLQLAQLYLSDHEADRSLGLAAISAITQSVFRQSQYVPDKAGDSLGELDLVSGDHLGMIGYFPSLLRQLKKRGIKTTVIERKEHLQHSEGEIRVTMDIEKLASCNKVLITASTLLNDSLDEVLSYCGEAEKIVMVGPTAGFFPDPLFDRNISVIGGAVLTDVSTAIERLRDEQGLGDTAKKYLIKRQSYPGIDSLIRR